MSAKRKAVGEIEDGRKRRNVEAGREYSEKYNDPKADVELISSDNVVFRVHGYHLMASSIFFRDLLSENTAIEQGVIPLTDDKLENADALLNFLDCITGKDISDLLTDIAKARRLITLLFKYDCPMAVTAMRWQVRLLATTDSKALNPFKLWKLCLALDDPIGVRDLIPSAAGLRWEAGQQFVTERDEATASQAVSDSNALDPTGMTIDTLSAMSPKYLVAFMRGYAKRGDTGESNTGGDWEAVAEEFYRVYTR